MRHDHAGKGKPRHLSTGHSLGALRKRAAGAGRGRTEVDVPSTLSPRLGSRNLFRILGPACVCIADVRLVSGCCRPKAIERAYTRWGGVSKTAYVTPLRHSWSGVERDGGRVGQISNLGLCRPRGTKLTRLRRTPFLVEDVTARDTGETSAIAWDREQMRMSRRTGLLRLARTTGYMGPSCRRHGAASLASR